MEAELILLDDLQAFLTEHPNCGEFDGSVERNRVSDDMRRV